jgi:osmotically-inducible protein OsmY
MPHDLRADVAAELDWDPRVDSDDIKVAANGGAVTLRGTVGSLWHMRQAENAVRRVRGVISVANHLRVAAVARGSTEDADIRTAALHALLLNTTIPASITVDVANGVVRLTGKATWQHQREAAELVCAALAGVLDITDEITLIPSPANDDIQKSIISCYRRNAQLTLRELSVDALESGIVILSGTVTCWDEHDQAVAAAWSAPGVTRVDDRILLLSDGRHR